MLLIKYRLYYLVSHYHYKQAGKCITKQAKYFKNMNKWRKYEKKFYRHLDRFNKLQIPIDKLKEEISAKYGD